MGAYVGIDLGTTYSAVARVDPATGRADVLPNAERDRLTPSVVWFGTDPPTVGREAKEQQRAGATDVAAFFKRHMGDPYFVLDFGGRPFTPVDLSALVLTKLKRDAEAALGQPVTDAVITVPAYFDDAKRRDTIAAGEKAGLTVLRIINEPTAAALAYGIGQAGRDETTLVYDLGGGTFDVTVVRITPAEVTVLGTDGDHKLGGKDWDDRVARYLAGRFRDDHGSDPLDDPDAWAELQVRCETAKRTLTQATTARVELDHAGARGRYDLTRDKFDELTADLMERTQMLTEKALADAGLTWDRLTGGVLLVGGSSKMPMVSRYVQRMSGKAPRTGVNPDEAVALGAAVQAAMDVQARQPQRKLRIAGERAVRDVMSHGLGMVAVGQAGDKYFNAILIHKNVPIPAAFDRAFKFRTRPGPDNECEVYITQGESDRPGQCSYLGKYVIAGIRHERGKEVVLTIRYEYDRNGVVQVSALDTRDGRALPVRVDQVPADMSWVDRPPVVTAYVPEPVTIYLAIDVSYSMDAGGLDEAKQAAMAFTGRCDLSHMAVGLVSFGAGARTELRACQDAGRIDRAVRGLSCHGTTDMVAGLREAGRNLSGAPGNKFLVLLTDGVPDDAAAADSAARACRAQGIEVVAIGTAGADVAFLAGLASSQENAVFASAGDLAGTFSSIAQAITEQAGQGGGLRLNRS